MTTFPPQMGSFARLVRSCHAIMTTQDGQAKALIIVSAMSRDPDLAWSRRRDVYDDPVKPAPLCQPFAASKRC